MTGIDATNVEKLLIKKYKTMEIFKIVIGILVLISLALYIGDLEISFDPLIVKLNRPFLMYFVIFSCAAALCLAVDMYDKGYNEAKNYINDENKEMVK